MQPTAPYSGSPAQQGASSAQAINFIAPESVSESSRIARLFSFCLPKVADLFGKNYQAAKTANRDSHLMMFEQSSFNAMIDSAIKKLKDPKETNQSIWEFIKESGTYKDVDGKSVRFSSQVDARLNGLGCSTFFKKIDDTEMSKREIEALLLGNKYRAQKRPLAVTRLINIADSLHVTAQEQKQVDWTSVQILSKSDLLWLSDELMDAKCDFRNYSTTHQQLQGLFDRLIQITPDTSKEDLEELFKLYQVYTHLMDHSEAFDQFKSSEGENSDAPFNRFYQDLKKPDSTFLTHLDGEIQKKRISANQAKKEVQLLEREKRSLEYLKFKKWFDPTEGLVFFDLFHKINHFTVQKPMIARAVEWMNSSVKDKSLSSFWATIGITSLVASYVLYKVAQFFFALTIATVCYAVGSIAWVLATLVRDCIGQGSHYFVDWLKRGEIKDLSSKNRSEIANETRLSIIDNQLRSQVHHIAGVKGLEIERILKRPMTGQDVADFGLAGQRPVWG
ncbi:MAG: hypothetical protein EB053_03070 [Chlamydiae bacterium]|nr:hypothetical protein [Chlamydiota bacterium]